jgi:hypothetical protein
MRQLAAAVPPSHSRTSQTTSAFARDQAGNRQAHAAFARSDGAIRQIVSEFLNCRAPK